MMIILTIVILKLLIIFNIYNRLGVINKSNGKHFKKDRWRILACGTASNESVGLVYVTR